MLTNLSRHLALSLPMYEPDPPAGGGNPPASDPPESKPDEKVTFDAKQQEAINALLAAERKSTEEKVAARLKQEADDAKAKADAEAERKRQEAAGEYEGVKASLTGERDAAITERDSLKAENDTLAAYFDAQYTAALNDLPDVIKAFAPAEDAGIAEKTTWLTKATEQAKALEKQQPARGNGANPPASDGRVEVPSAVNRNRMWS